MIYVIASNSKRRLIRNKNAFIFLVDNREALKFTDEPSTFTENGNIENSFVEFVFHGFLSRSY